MSAPATGRARTPRTLPPGAATRCAPTCSAPSAGGGCSARPAATTPTTPAPPKPGYVPDGHPPSLWVRQAPLLDGITGFFAEHIFGPNRHDLLAATQPRIDAETQTAHQARIDAVRRTLADLDKRHRRQIRALEVTDEPDPDFIRHVRTRIAELKTERATKQAELDQLEAHTLHRPNPQLLHRLPLGEPDLANLPEPTLRRLFEAFRLQIHYDKRTNTATCHLTLTAETLPAVAHITNTNLVRPTQPPPKTHNNGIQAPQRRPTPLLFPSVACPRGHTPPAVP